jgi:hypothetical protein
VRPGQCRSPLLRAVDGAHEQKEQIAGHA